jgi:hypothetical protein
MTVKVSEFRIFEWALRSVKPKEQQKFPVAIGNICPIATV